MLQHHPKESIPEQQRGAIMRRIGTEKDVDHTVVETAERRGGLGLQTVGGIENMRPYYGVGTPISSRTCRRPVHEGMPSGPSSTIWAFSVGLTTSRACGFWAAL